MRTHTAVLALMFSFTLVFFAAASRADAQTSHAATPSALDAALQEHAVSTSADRERVLRLLQRNDVTAIAGAAGLDVKTAASAVATMNAQELSRIAAQARQAEQALAGGQTVTLNAVWIIIGLLVIILIVVAS
ncbi:MAG: DUF6627 family protein [Vicinamibacterales bacterium]